MQARQDIIGGVLPLTRVETEGAIVKQPTPAESQPALNTSEQVKAPDPFVSSEEAPRAERVQASTDTTTTRRITPAVGVSGATVSLWEEAYNKLRKDEPKMMEAFRNALIASQSTESSSHHATTPGKLQADKQDQLQALANRQLDELSQKRYRLSIGEKDIVVRDQFKKILKVVLTFKDLISTTIAAEPVAAMAWAGVSFALQVRFFFCFWDLGNYSWLSLREPPSNHLNGPEQN